MKLHSYDTEAGVIVLYDDEKAMIHVLAVNEIACFERPGRKRRAPEAEPVVDPRQTTLPPPPADDDDDSDLLDPASFEPQEAGA